MNDRISNARTIFIVGLLFGPLLAPPASAEGCPPGESEMLPDLRALPARDIAMLDPDKVKFSATSWNAGYAKLVLVARTPVTDPNTGQTKQPVDQRISCTGGGYYDHPAGSAEYHPSHNHVHYDDYANYILEEDIANPQNPRQGTKTTFCIMDTTITNTQLSGASASAFFSQCATQDPNFNTQGMSVGWGDTYGSNLPGQNLFISDLPPGLYRFRHVFDPKNRIKETAEDDNESCELIEIGDGLNGRYVADRGLCNPPPPPQISAMFPGSASQNSCVYITITGDNLVPEMQAVFSGGTGPLPIAKNITFDQAGTTINATVCVPKAKGGKKPQLGSHPVWNVSLRNPSLSYVGSATLADGFTVTP